MWYRYGEFEDQPFPTPDSLFPQPKVVEFLLQYGKKALQAMEQLDAEQEKQYVQAMIDAGLLERDPKTGELRLTPRMVRGIEHRSLLDIFENMQRGTREGHPALTPGRGDERTDGSKPYEYGDSLADLDMAATLRNALRRQRAETGTPAPGSQTKPLLPLRLGAGDLELHVTESQSDVALCILLDLSGSMARYGRFFQAKRVALGLSALMRQRYPQDTIDYVGFYSTAATIRESELPLIMPKPISTQEYQVRLRLPLAQALKNPGRLPQHFTNLQLGLRMARQLLARRPASNKQIFVVTDGQPTAHVEPAPAAQPGTLDLDGSGEMLYLIYPPSERTRNATLNEALRCHEQGIRIATFALVEDYWGMDWVGFINQMTRLTCGVAFYCSGEDLGSTVIENYLSGKRRKSFVS